MVLIIGGALIYQDSFISYLRSIMPPKKRVNKANEGDAPAEIQPKPVEKTEPVPQPKKQQTKPEQKPVAQPPPQVAQSPLARLEQAFPQEQTQPKPDENAEQKPQKIVIDDASKLSEEEKLKLRRLRFGLLGTQTTAEQAEKIKQERLKKFGGPSVEDKETIEKRKQKFSNAPIAAEDPQVVKRRLEKFGVVGAPGVSEDKTILEERKKKFGDPQANVNLDEQIKKSKPIKKFHPKFNNQKHGQKSHHDNRNFRR